MKLVLAIYALGISALLAGCGSQKLDRPLAERLIRENEAIIELQNKVTLNKNAETIGQRFRWWNRLTDGFSSQSLERGLNKEFIKIFVNWEVGYVELTTPVQIAIEVTGVSTSKDDVRGLAEFKWRYQDLKPYVAYLAGEGGNGKAMLQRYDDGWRIVGFTDLARSQTPYALSEAQAREMHEEVARLEEQERIAKVKEAEARARRLVDAKKLLVGTWDSRSRLGSTRFRFKPNGTFERLGSSDVVWGAGTWSVNADWVNMQELEVRGANGLMYRNESPPMVLKILDISPTNYHVEQAVVYTGGTKGKESYKAVRVQ